MCSSRLAVSPLSSNYTFEIKYQLKEKQELRIKRIAWIICFQYARPSRGGKTRPMHFDTDNSSSDDDGPSNKRPRIEPKTQVDPRDAASSSSDRQNGQHQPNQVSNRHIVIHLKLLNLFKIM